MPTSGVIPVGWKQLRIAKHDRNNTGFIQRGGLEATSICEGIALHHGKTGRGDQVNTYKDAPPWNYIRMVTQKLNAQTQDRILQMSDTRARNDTHNTMETCAY